MDTSTTPQPMNQHIPLTPKQRGRALVLCALGLAAIVAFWWAVRTTVELTDFSELQGLWRPALAFVLFGITIGFLGLSASIMHTSNIGGLTILLGAISASLIFPLTIATAAGCLVVIIAWGRYWAMVSEEAMSRLKYSLVKNTTHGLGSVITLTVLSVALFYLGYASTTHETNDQFIKRATDGAGSAIVNILEKQLPGFKADMTVDDFLSQYGQNQISTVVPMDFIPQPVNQSLLPDAERSRLESLDQAARTAALVQARTALLAPLNIKVDGNEHMDVVVKALVAQKIRPLLEEYQHYIPPVLALAVFSALSLLGIIYFWWIVGWAAIWYGLVHSFHWITKREETVSVHRLMIGL